MPYIRSAERERLADYEKLPAPLTAGELNYLITRLVCRYLATGPINYERLNGVMGVFGSAAAEFYRRVVAPYENMKTVMNGDAYDPELLP